MAKDAANVGRADRRAETNAEHAAFPLSPETYQELEKRFTYHPPKEGQLEEYVLIHKIAFDFALQLSTLMPPCRELSLALTKLEECVQAANAGIARRT